MLMDTNSLDYYLYLDENANSYSTSIEDKFREYWVAEMNRKKKNKAEMEKNYRQKYSQKYAIKKKYEIKQILVNPKKNTTTVLWADGTHTVVKRSESDEPADIWQVVSYALAEKVYGSNSAFKRIVKGKVEKQTKKEKGRKAGEK